MTNLPVLVKNGAAAASVVCASAGASTGASVAVSTPESVTSCAAAAVSESVRVPSAISDDPRMSNACTTAVSPARRIGVDRLLTPSPSISPRPKFTTGAAPAMSVPSGFLTPKEVLTVTSTSVAAISTPSMPFSAMSLAPAFRPTKVPLPDTSVSTAMPTAAPASSSPTKSSRPVAAPWPRRIVTSLAAISVASRLRRVPSDSVA